MSGATEIFVVWAAAVETLCLAFILHGFKEREREEIDYANEQRRREERMSGSA